MFAEIVAGEVHDSPDARHLPESLVREEPDLGGRRNVRGEAVYQVGVGIGGKAWAEPDAEAAVNAGQKPVKGILPKDDRALRKIQVRPDRQWVSVELLVEADQSVRFEVSNPSYS